MAPRSKSSSVNQMTNQLKEQSHHQTSSHNCLSPSVRLSMAMIVVILVNSLMIQSALGQLTFSKSWVAGGGKRSSSGPSSAMLDDLMGNIAYQPIDSPFQYQLQLLQASPDDGMYELLLKHKALTELLTNTWKSLLKDDHCYRLLSSWHNGGQTSGLATKMSRSKRSTA